MAWIESHQELGRHPKTRKLARALNISRPAVVGHLHYLWWWALDFAQDGDLSRYAADELAEAALWDGDPDALVEALAQAGFLDRNPLRLHDWEEYAGKLLDQRKANARRQRDFRNRHKTAADATPDVTHNNDVTPSNGYVTVTSQSRNAATEQYLTEQYPTVPEDTDDSECGGHSIIVADADASSDDDSAPHAPDADVSPSEPDVTPEKPVAPVKIAPDAPAMRLAIQLREAVLAHNSTALDARKAMTGQGIQAWARKLEALISDPRRAPPDVEAVIAYAASASFWQPIVINPDKLKKHYDTINGQRLNARNGKNGHSNGGNSNGSMGRAAAAQASRPYHDRSVSSRSGSVQGNAGGWTPERADEFNEQARAIRQQFARSSGGNA